MPRLDDVMKFKTKEERHEHYKKLELFWKSVLNCSKNWKREAKIAIYRIGEERGKLK